MIKKKGVSVARLSRCVISLAKLTSKSEMNRKEWGDLLNDKVVEVFNDNQIAMVFKISEEEVRSWIKARRFRPGLPEKIYAIYLRILYKALVDQLVRRVISAKKENLRKVKKLRPKSQLKVQSQSAKINKR